MISPLRRRIGWLARRYMPQSFEDLARRFDWLFKDSGYRTVRADGGSDAYKTLLGGGAEHWEQRGSFQRHLLENLGLSRSHTLLDVGCGPGRASQFLIEYLGPGAYVGVDYNPDFVEIARSTVAEAGLSSRSAEFFTLGDFELSSLGRTFDFLLAFSVLNHCNDRQKLRFFAEAPGVLNPGGRIVISHARWLSQRYLTNHGLTLVRTIKKGDPPLETVVPTEYGFTEGEIDPLVVLERTAVG